MVRSQLLRALPQARPEAVSETSRHVRELLGSAVISLPGILSRSVLAEYYASAGDHGAAAEIMESALREPHDGHFYEQVNMREVEAGMLMAKGEHARAVECATNAAGIAARMSRPTVEWRALSILADAHERLGNSAAAIDARQRGLDIVESLAGNIGDLDLRAGFLNSHLVTRLRDGTSGKARLDDA